MAREGPSTHVDCRVLGHYNAGIRSQPGPGLTGGSIRRVPRVGWCNMLLVGTRGLTWALGG